MGQTQLTGPVITASQGIFQASTIQLHNLGAYVESADGRGYRYCEMGGTASVAGKVYQSRALDATNEQPSGGLAVTAAAIADTDVTLSGTLTLAVNLLAEGYMSIAVTPGQGYVYKIKSNTAVAAAANCVVTLEDPLQVALTTASKVIVCAHPYKDVVVEPGTPTGAIVGVAQDIIAADSFGWLQVRGVASVLFTGTGVAGKAVGSLTGGTSGSAAPAIAATNILGYHMATGITTEYSLIYLNIG